jgi:hypothetical protein
MVRSQSMLALPETSVNPNFTNGSSKREGYELLRKKNDATTFVQKNSVMVSQVESV